MSPSAPPAGRDPQGTARVPAHSTSSATRSWSAISCFILYICRDMSFCPVPPLQGRTQVVPLVYGSQQVREFLQDYIGSKKLFERGSCLAPFEGLQVAPRNLQ